MKKVAFITGAGGFLGSETARTLAKNGIAIAVCDINEEAINKTVESIKAMGGEAFGRVLDVADSADVDAAVDETVEKYGRLDIMVHIAGGSCRIAGDDVKSVNLVEFLVSDKARFITGQTYVCDGGRSLAMKGSD